MVQMVDQAFTKSAFGYQAGRQLMKPSGVSHAVWDYLTRNLLHPHLRDVCLKSAVLIGDPDILSPTSPVKPL